MSPGSTRRRAQIDDLIGRQSVGGTDALDPVAANQDRAIANRRAAAAVDDLRRADQHGARGRRLFGGPRAKRGERHQRRRRQQDVLLFQVSCGVVRHGGLTLPCGRRAACEEWRTTETRATA